MSTDALIKALRPIFGRVRTDVSWVKRADGSMHRSDKPLTKGGITVHLTGGEARGAVPMKPGERTTRIALLDLDSHRGESSWPEMQAAARRVLDTLGFEGAHGLAFRSSGGKGIHIYLLWEDPQDAYSVRAFLTQSLALCGFTNGPGGVARREIEVFPKQDEIAEGKFGSQFILPLAGKSVPLHRDTLADLPPDAVLDPTWWPECSDPVPLVAREERARPSNDDPETADMADIKSALHAIPNSGAQELTYDGWRNIMFALHSATKGSDEGHALAHAFSAKSSKYDPDFFNERVWPYIKDASEGSSGITVRTLFAEARKHGWRESIEDMFAPITGAVTGAGARATPAEREPMPAFVRDKGGAIEATVDNAVKAVRRVDICGMRIGYDAFRDDLTVAPDGSTEWRSITDADMVRIRIFLERCGFKSAPKELARDAVTLAAAENEYDSAIQWLSALSWDGVPRVEGFLHTYMSAQDTPYTRAVSRYLWSAMAGRVLIPGCQADMVPVLEGSQGVGKTSAIKAMAPAPEYYAEIDLAAKEEDTVRKMRGVLVGEIAELSGLRSKEREAIKKFITRTHEKWVPKFKEFQTMFARRLLFIGTTNSVDLFDDETGNRRWLPVHVGKVDVEAVKRDRDQLWAEGAAMLRLLGHPEYADAERLAGEEHAKYENEDAWEGLIAQWLEADVADVGLGVTPKGKNSEHPFRMSDALAGALHMKDADMGRPAQLRAGAALRRLGFEKRTIRVNGALGKFWIKKEHADYLAYVANYVGETRDLID